MIILEREFNLIIIVLSLSLGFQLAFYFIVQYFRYKKDKLLYNPINASTSVMNFFLWSGYFIDAFRHYYADKNLHPTLLMIQIILFSLVLIVFYIPFLINKDLRVFPPIIPKILFTYSCVTLILYSIFSNDLIFFGINFSAIAIGVLMVLYFQIRQTVITSGRLRRSLFVSTSGLFLVFLSGGSIGIVIILGPNEFIRQAGIILMFFGLIINCIGYYFSPPYLESNWKEEIQALYVFERTSFRILYKHHFKLAPKKDLLQSNHLDDIISRSITGIDQIIKKLSKSQDEKISKIKQEGSTILLEYDEDAKSPAIFALVVSSDMKSLRFFLKTLKKEFQDKYRLYLNNLDIIQGNEERIFIKFRENIKLILR